MYIVVDPGSTHMGKPKLVREIIEKAKAGGADAVKFQLFPDSKTFTDTGNVYMSPDLFDYAHKQGKLNRIDVTASVFGHKESEFLASYKVPFVKFAYSMKDDISSMEGWLNMGRKVVVTTDIMSMSKLPEHEKLITLYTATVDGKTLYPCMFEIDFEGMFNYFNGFSDHTLGCGQAQRAKEYGCKWIEKHAGLKYVDVECPDKAFCLDINYLGEFVKAVR